MKREDLLVPIIIRAIFAKNNRDWFDFGICWEWAIKQEWWPDFVDGPFSVPGTHKRVRELKLINPSNFADAVYEFLKEKKV